jgi:toxin ParE1/3/4
MSGRRLVLRELARSDVDETIDFYLREAGERVALGFVDALERTFRSIADRPAAGSPRYAHELNLPGLRSWSLRRYPFLVFYVERDDQIDVWRVLHSQRDIPAWLQGASQ